MEFLSASVLVLNKNYIPIDTCSARDAIVLVYKGAAKVVNQEYQAFDFKEWEKYSKENPGDKINSPTTSIIVPDTILVMNYADYPKRRIILKYSRRNVFMRDHLTCQYCGKKGTVDTLTIDHIVPKSKGGLNTYENVVSACKPCNNKKRDRYLSESGMKLLSTPIAPNWYNKVRNHNSWEKFFMEK